MMTTCPVSVSTGFVLSIKCELIQYSEQKMIVTEFGFLDIFKVLIENINKISAIVNPTKNLS